MSSVRSAQKNGNGRFLYPREVESIEEAPWDLSAAIAHATKIMSWMENLQRDEIPPEWMWPFDDELEIWFENVDREREARYSGGDKEDPDKPMMGNELSERFKK